MSRSKSYGGKRSSKNNSLLVPNLLGTSKSDFSFKGSNNSIQPIMEDRVLESLCESTNIEVTKMRGSTISCQERKKLFGKFQRHSETQDLFKSEDQMSKFMSDLYTPNKSELSLAVPRVTMRKSNLSICSRKSNIDQSDDMTLSFIVPKMQNGRESQTRDSKISLSRLSIESRLSTQKSVGKLCGLENDNRGGRDVLKFLQEDPSRTRGKNNTKKPKPKSSEQRLKLKRPPPLVNNRPSTVVENTREYTSTGSRTRF